ncbi:hypothetical protein [Paraburkholderia tropica]|uniref:hypothetical protein n=1 Tax=Paraburkholderia tropica TaxID=92647 RepID=UPI002AB084F8|nr:hypothetical protein [Paraburkholderia tropica]
MHGARERFDAIGRFTEREANQRGQVRHGERVQRHVCQMHRRAIAQRVLPLQLTDLFGGKLAARAEQ